MKVNPQNLSKARPKIVPDDLEEDVLVLQIAGYEESSFTDQDGERASAFLTFQNPESAGEVLEKVVFLNVTAAKALVARYGDDSDKWIGKPVPLNKQAWTFGAKSGTKVGVMPLELWDLALKESGFLPRERRPRIGGVKAKRGKRR